MADTDKPLLIKRYASRRLYNTETSDYVTLEDIAGFIRTGREVQIVDLKTGDDLTRQYLLQIVAEHESKGESVLPVGVLTDLVRSYATGMQVRREVLGDAHVDRAEAAKTDFDAPFQDLITNAAWGTVWASDAIPRRERSMLTLALLAATGNFDEIPMHIRATARTGASK